MQGIVRDFAVGSFGLTPHEWWQAREKERRRAWMRAVGVGEG